ncbi:hypothetical protein FA13DRAFT_139199 [Coprinellus micaceus]|uniref:Uncharacterized protein n=1 Tax=Coprinellus micaceus TaxID=71717 RepID=A0A4Y7SHN2_COPMI|nr:hypothetical protein FA13DRAFT_139199 [Coprinellus micaceus]
MRIETPCWATSKPPCRVSSLVPTSGPRILCWRQGLRECFIPLPFRACPPVLFLFLSPLPLKPRNALNLGFKPWEWLESGSGTPLVPLPLLSFASSTRSSATSKAQTFVCVFVFAFSPSHGDSFDFPKLNAFQFRWYSSLLPCAISSYAHITI